MSSFLNRWRGRDGEHNPDVELGGTNHTAQTNPEVGQIPTTAAPLIPIPQHQNALVTGAGSLNVAPETASHFLLRGMPPQVRQVQMQVEKRRREHELPAPATKFRAVEGPTTSLINEEIKRYGASAREVLDENHQNTINTMNADFAAIVQGYQDNIESLQASAKKTEESTKQIFDAMRVELNQAKKDKEDAQKENADFRGLLSALQKEIDDIKAGAAEVPDGDGMLQDEGGLVLQHANDIAQLKLDSEAAMEEHKKEMASMKSQMAEFSNAMKDAKETIADLKDQLKTTQERALQAERENSDYRGDISTLTNKLHAEQKRCKELETAATARAVTTDASDSSRTPAPHQRLDLGASKDVQPVSQHQDADMIDDTGLTRDDADDDDMYGSDDGQDDNMAGNKAEQKSRRKAPSTIAGASTSRDQAQKVASPRGGQGPHAKIAMSSPWNNRGDEAPAKQKRRKTYTAEAVQDLFNFDTDDSGDETDDEEQGTEEDDESDDAQERAEGRKGRDSKQLNVFSNPKLRGHNPKRAKLLRLVRKLMNQILGMEKDADIVDVEFAAPEEVARYEDDQSEPPTSAGFRPTFQKGFSKTEWHLFLEEAFIDRFTEVHHVNLGDKARDCIAVLFTDRLIRLRKKWMQLTKKMSDADREARKARADSRGRRNVRRLNVFDFRRTVCLESITTPEGHKDEGWAATLEMVLRLGPAGMSSDDSDVQNDRPVYFVRKRHWRSAEATDRLLFIDGQRNTTNGVGKPRPGNPARERIRSAQNGRQSKRDPTIKCPKNFYDRGFVKGLSNLRFRALKMAPAMDLGYIEDA